MASRAKPVVIEVGLNEATTRDESPWVPISPEEIAVDAMRCAEAGASIVHFHARDPGTGAQRLDDTELYRAAVKAVRAAGCDVLLYPSYPAFLSGSGDPLAERFGHVLALADDPQLGMRIAPLDMGSLNFVFATDGKLAALPLEQSVYQNPIPLLERMAEQCDARGLLATLAIFELGHLRATLALLASGRLRHAMLKLLLNGRWLHGPLPDPDGLGAYLRMLDALRGDREIPWMCAPSAIDSPEPIEALLRSALGRGGHVRVGVGDNPVAAAGRSNRELVLEAVSLAAEYGRAPARPAEVLKLCGLTPAP
jgi:uncharacterized protein (DUF849 family)